jgi:REP element-mobilizing transposase RayT
MSRYARRKSSTNIYHVMLRGIDRMPVFYGNGDRFKFLEIIDRMNEEGEYEIYAYCLMENHIHLLFKEGQDSIAKSLKRIAVSYAYYFNNRYDRVGHVFQGRFRSEPIENDNYLMAVVRYIHNNPVKAGIVKKAVDYSWSSYQEYIKYGNDSARVNTKLLLQMFSHNEIEAIGLFIEFSNENSKDKFIDIDNKADKPIKEQIGSDEDIIEKVLINHKSSLSEISNIKDKKKRNEIIRYIKNNTSISIRSLSRILGISKDIIFRA